MTVPEDRLSTTPGLKETSEMIVDGVENGKSYETMVVDGDINVGDFTGVK